jgi:hypothetical protein
MLVALKMLISTDFDIVAFQMATGIVNPNLFI